MLDIMKGAETEPEAAALRSTLRQVLTILTSSPLAPSKSRLRRIIVDAVFPHSDKRIASAAAVIREALKRPRTNGKVIDELERENGDLRSHIIDLEIELKMLKGAAGAEK